MGGNKETKLKLCLIMRKQAFKELCASVTSRGREVRRTLVGCEYGEDEVKFQGWQGVQLQRELINNGTMREQVNEKSRQMTKCGNFGGPCCWRITPIITNVFTAGTESRCSLCSGYVLIKQEHLRSSCKHRDNGVFIRIDPFFPRLHD